MAKQARDEIESGFDFSKFLDLDEEDSNLEPSTDTGGFDYHTLPHSRDEIVTGGLDRDIEAAVEGYIRAGKVSWGEKKAIRKLAVENRRLEGALKDTDAAILERADGYHAIVSNILREKNDFEGFALNDNDPYDSEPLSVDEQSLGARAARIQSTDLFREIEKLELHRSELNDQRSKILDEISDAASNRSNAGWGELTVAITERLDAISKVQDITKVKFTEEDEAIFDQSVDAFTDYISGDFDPLAEEDEYGDGESFDEEVPLSHDGHTEAEILAMEEVELPEDAKSFGALFGAEPDVAAFDDTSATFEETEHLEDEEIADDDAELAAVRRAENEGLAVLPAAPEGVGYELPEDVQGVDVELEENELADLESVLTGFGSIPEPSEDEDPEAESWNAELEAAVAEDETPLGEDWNALESDLEDVTEWSSPEPTHGDVAEALEADLSPLSFEAEGNIDRLKGFAEDASWYDTDADADLPYTDFLDGDLLESVEPAEPEADEEIQTETPSTTFDFVAEDDLGAEATPLFSSTQEKISSGLVTDDVPDDENAPAAWVYDPSAPIRTLIFDELKEKYGISFEGVPGLED